MLICFQVKEINKQVWCFLHFYQGKRVFELNHGKNFWMFGWYITYNHNKVA